MGWQHQNSRFSVSGLPAYLWSNFLKSGASYHVEWDVMPKGPWADTNTFVDEFVARVLKQRKKKGVKLGEAPKAKNFAFAWKLFARQKRFNY